MPKKTVYAFRGANIIGSYPIVLDPENRSVTDQELVDDAKRNMKKNGVDPGSIASARYEVRDE